MYPCFRAGVSSTGAEGAWEGRRARSATGADVGRRRKESDFDGTAGRVESIKSSNGLDNLSPKGKRMLTQRSRVLEKYGLAIGVVLGVALLAVCAGPALAQDLTDGVSTATSSFKSIIKTVFSIAAIVIVVGGLVLSAFKFTQRDPHAVQYLVGTIAAGAICGIVSGML